MASTEPKNSGEAMIAQDTRSTTSANPFIPAFEHFRAQLDEHHDRRERTLKASRDITAASKKMIFALQRAPADRLAQPLPPAIAKQLIPHTNIIRACLASIRLDLATGPNAHRYARSVSPGLQEWVEAVVFQQYLSTGRLLTYQEAKVALEELLQTTSDEQEQTKGADVDGLSLGYEDYILGLFDATGELMRFAVTAMATTGSLPTLPSSSESEGAKGTKRTILSDLQALLQGLVKVDVAANSPYFWRGKLEVAKQSTEKVERALYGLVVRGAERPKGWMPELEVRGRGGEEES